MKQTIKNKNIFLRNLFLVLAVAVAVIGIALGIFFGFDTTATINIATKTPVTKTVFELWRAFIFWFAGGSSALCLFAVSTVFGNLNKK